MLPPRPRDGEKNMFKKEAVSMAAMAAIFIGLVLVGVLVGNLMGWFARP